MSMFNNGRCCYTDVPKKTSTMDCDEDLLEDTHFCLLCKQTIIGLDEYVHHKRQTCPSSKNNKANENVNDKQDVVVVRTVPNEEPEPDDFFLSLELQSNKPKDETTSNLIEPSTKSGTSTNATSGFDEYYEVNQHGYDDEGCLTDDDEDDDENYPPRHHTGGKWKPASPLENFENNNNNQSLTVTEHTSSGYNCSPCGLKIEDELSLIKHLQSPSHWTVSRLHPEHEALVLKYSSKLALHAPFCCAVCRFYFNSLEYLIEHWSAYCRQHQQQSGFQCSICDVCFAHPQKLVGHLRSLNHTSATCDTPLVISVIKGKGSLRCAICPYVARTGKSFVAHMRWKHPDTDSSKLTTSEEHLPEVTSTSVVDRPCRHCDFVATSLIALKEHVRLQHADKLFQCTVCLKDFLYQSVLSRHQERHRTRRGRPRGPPSICNENNNTMPFSCPTCTYRCDTKTQLLFHETRHSKAVIGIKQELDTTSSDGQKKYRKVNVKLYRCPSCQELLPRILLYRHILEHTGEKPYSCQHCDVAFAHQSSLYSHDKSVHGGKHLACPQCEYRTFKKSKLDRHIETHSDDRPRPFLCDICGAKFHQSYSLKHHKKLHFGDKKHRCHYDGCSRSYRSFSELEVHIRTHTNERPFLCPECGYAAKTRHQLTKHERSHTGERPFKCPHCSYAAALSAQLWRHLRIHTGARPYSCPHCSYTCNTSENLRKHVLKSKKHQGLNVYVCPHCSYGCDLVKELQEHVLDQHRDTIGADLNISPTYISLLSGVYDRSASKGSGVTEVPVVRVPQKRNRRFRKRPEEVHSEKTAATNNEEHLLAVQEHLLSEGVIVTNETQMIAGELFESEAVPTVVCEVPEDGSGTHMPEDQLMVTQEQLMLPEAEQQLTTVNDGCFNNFLGDENIVSVQVIDDVSVLGADGDIRCDDGSGNTFILPLSSLDNDTFLSLDGEVLTTTTGSDGLKSEENDAVDGNNTILIYVPMC